MNNYNLSTNNYDIRYQCQLLTYSFLQRVPVTEKSGRVHTSAVSVAILPQADEVLTFSVDFV